MVRPWLEPYTPCGHSVHDAAVAPPVEYEPVLHSPVHEDVLDPAAEP